MTTPSTQKQHITAILQALLVTFLWSTSWVLIKFGLDDIPALTFAGLRYSLAFLMLLPAFFRSRQARELPKLPRKFWWTLAGLGVLYYTITQGTQFLGLELLPAITFSLLLNLSAPIVAVLGIFFLKEFPTRIQWVGIGVFLVGVAVYFYPVFIPAGMAVGLLVGLLSVLATSFSSILGRGINRLGQTPPLTVTVISMGIGGILLLVLGLLVEPAPVLGWKQWGIILWLALVNTAVAFTLWNHTLRTLSAAESSIINNTMMVQIAVLAWVFLGERPGPMQFLGMAFALAGTVMVNVKGKVGDQAPRDE
jgi:drug/metabolite transporter (DMT)-like permease